MIAKKLNGIYKKAGYRTTDVVKESSRALDLQGSFFFVVMQPNNQYMGQVRVYPTREVQIERCHVNVKGVSIDNRHDLEAVLR